jgi:hypothetical protein
VEYLEKGGPLDVITSVLEPSVERAESADAHLNFCDRNKRPANHPALLQLSYVAETTWL